MRPVALITGAAGLLGRYLVRTASRWSPRWHVRGLTRQDVDLTDFAQVEAAFRTIAPRAVIHCAALSRPAACERDPNLAHRVNVEATAVLASLAADIPFFYFSSDQVFDGTRGRYVETDDVNPVNVYGETKAAAERIVSGNARHTIIRVALTAGISPTGDRSFVEDMCRAARGHRLTLFTDEYRTPIPAGVVARATWEIVERAGPGLYHLGGSERLSRMDIGEALALWHPELASRMDPGLLKDYSGPRRPVDLSMRCDKLQRLISFSLPGWREWLSGRPRRGRDLWDYLEP